jgi:Predicted integral membrane protein
MNLFYLATLFIIPITLVGLSLLWRKSGPKKINGMYGYRTRRSKASQEAWDFAHIYSSKLFLLTGIIQFVLTGLICISYWSIGPDFIENLITIILTIQSLSLILVILMTELALKKNFDKNGKCLIK